MVNQIDRQQGLQGQADQVARAAWAVGTTRWLTSPGGLDDHYLLEDHDGLPIACPLCGQVDHWRATADSLTGAPRAFSCAHVARIDANGLTRRVATVSIDQVADYLPLASLLPSVA